MMYCINRSIFRIVILCWILVFTAQASIGKADGSEKMCRKVESGSKPTTASTIPSSSTSNTPLSSSGASTSAISIATRTSTSTATVATTTILLPLPTNCNFGTSRNTYFRIVAMDPSQKYYSAVIVVNNDPGIGTRLFLVPDLTRYNTFTLNSTRLASTSPAGAFADIKLNLATSNIYFDTDSSLPQSSGYVNVAVGNDCVMNLMGPDTTPNRYKTHVNIGNAQITAYVVNLSVNGPAHTQVEVTLRAVPV